jgi:hypothetical protein
MEDQNATVNTIDEALSTETSNETVEAEPNSSQELPTDNDSFSSNESLPNADSIDKNSDEPAIDSAEESAKQHEHNNPVIAEEGGKVQNSPDRDEWRKKLQSFHDVTNGQLAAKENFKLVCIDKKAKPAFAKNFSLEANRSFQLTVNLRRRLIGTKIGGKSVA